MKCILELSNILCFYATASPAEVTQTSLVWFCSPRTSSQWLDHWTRQRLKWWRKVGVSIIATYVAVNEVWSRMFTSGDQNQWCCRWRQPTKMFCVWANTLKLFQFALSPSDFSSTEVAEEGLEEPASHGVRILYRFPWGPETLETLWMRGNSELLQMHKGARSKLQVRLRLCFEVANVRLVWMYVECNIKYVDINNSMSGHFAFGNISISIKISIYRPDLPQVYSQQYGEKSSWELCQNFVDLSYIGCHLCSSVAMAASPFPTFYLSVGMWTEAWWPSCPTHSSSRGETAASRSCSRGRCVAVFSTSFACWCASELSLTAAFRCWSCIQWWLQLK